MSSGRQSFLVVFDFDDTAVDCNSDEVVPQKLGRSEFQQEMIRSLGDNIQWTNLCDAVVAPFTRAQLEDAVIKSVKMDKDMPEVFRFLSERYRKETHDVVVDDTFPDVEIAFASDANHVFIETAVNHCIPFAREAICQIHSNPFHEVDDKDGNDTAGGCRKCRVTWYEPAGHDCRCCADRMHPNMCKTLIIARLLHSTRLVDPTVVFIGDGENDYCPVLNILRPRDYMLARRSFPVHTAVADDRYLSGCCRTGLWRNAKELLSCLQHILSPAQRLPTLARFRDVGPQEFRAMTLSTRMPQVLSRTLADNAAHVSSEGQRLMEFLIDVTKRNGEVPPLPGQTMLPPWLQAYASVPEFDDVVQRNEKYNGASTVPKWGQLPWLHGEIYFYNLFAQYMLLLTTNSHDSSEKDALVPNFVTPYATHTCIKADGCSAGSAALAKVKHTTPLQFFNPSALAKNSSTEGESLTVADSVILRDKSKSFYEVMGGDSLVQKHGTFKPYRDFFVREKREVLHQFLRSKICPMLACLPWNTGNEFITVLLRWMLWGNAVDLSMFTLEALKAASSPSEKVSATGQFDEVEGLRVAELEAAMKQDERIVGNQLEDVARHIRRIIQEGTSCSGGASGERTVNIVMDNVGVECVADLIFTLWLLQHHPSLHVVLHVKSMPYYVSDVTPPDFQFLLDELECCSKQDAKLAAVLTPFVQLVRQGFDQGRICVDSDPFWTQPCEYREMPPHLCNSFFFNQRVPGSEESLGNHPQSISALFPNRLYKAHSALVIFKGDLNFRRLIGDRHWDRRSFMSTAQSDANSGAAAVNSITSTLLVDTPCGSGEKAATPSFESIVSAFWPVHAVPVCAIRTLKSEVCVGVASQQQDKLDRSIPNWRTSGAYGVILFATEAQG